MSPIDLPDEADDSVPGDGGEPPVVRDVDTGCTRRDFLIGGGTLLASIVLGGLARPAKALASFSPSRQHVPFGSPPAGINTEKPNPGMMEYRILPKGGERISVIGLGGSHLHEMTQTELDAVVDCAVENGVNLVDFAMPFPRPRDMFGKAMRGRRDKFVLQGHLGFTFVNDQYIRTRSVDESRDSFEDLLRRLGTDYIDFGLIHYVDEVVDFEEVIAGGLFDYAVQLKKEGKIRRIGFGTHNVEIAERFLDHGGVDMFMFSINPAYDLDPLRYDDVATHKLGESSVSMSEKRARLYQRCAAEGIGIVVMKAYGGGTLLDATVSPFGRAMTIPQCLQYCLDRPAVVSCLLGVTSVAQLEEAIRYCSSSREERDYSYISTLALKTAVGRCVYCNHCLPCPMEIDIGGLSKLLDLAVAGDELAREHYRGLSRNASDCTMCGICEENCPFGVAIMDRMLKAREVFGA